MVYTSCVINISNNTLFYNVKIFRFYDSKGLSLCLKPLRFDYFDSFITRLYHHTQFKLFKKFIILFVKNY